MRLSTLIRWAIFLAVLVWAGYTVAGAGWTYYAIQENVDKVLREASSRYRTALQTGTQTDSMARDVRGAIALNARRDGLAVQEADIQVSASGAAISATVLPSKTLRAGFFTSWTVMRAQLPKLAGRFSSSRN